MPHISVLCPYCETRYQLEPSLLGQQIRCPNSQCAEVFVVEEEGATPAPTSDRPAASSPHENAASFTAFSGSVGDLVPMLPTEGAATRADADDRPAELDKPLAEAQASPEADEEWQVEENSPSVPGDSAILPESPEAPAEVYFGDWEAPPAATALAASESASKSVQFSGGDWEAPPVRATSPNSYVGSSAPAAELREESASVATEVPESPLPTYTGRRNLLIIVGLLAFMGTGVALGLWLAQGERTEVEEERRQAARAEYEQRNFLEAARLYHYLQTDFPDSPHQQTYHFMSQLASLRNPLHSAQTNVKELSVALKEFLDFLDEYEGEDLLTKHHPDIWETLYSAAEELSKYAQQQVEKDVQRAGELLGAAQAVLAEAEKYTPPTNADSPGRRSAMKAALQKTSRLLARHKHRQELVDLLTLMSRQPFGNVVKQSHALVQEYAESQPALADDPEVQKLLGEMPGLHRASIKYTKFSSPSSRPDSQHHSLNVYLVNNQENNKLTESVSPRPVFALARGVLYAFDPIEGKVRWVKRLGAGATVLPTRLPANAIQPESFLVQMPAQRSLIAADADSGETLWEQQLQGTSPGQPVLVGRRAFLAQRDGRIDEIDTITGKLIGGYDVGQPLTGWGTRQPGSTLLYFPAENYNVFVIDVHTRKCVNILYSKHASGSLRGPPIIAANGLLLLNQIDGMNRSKLRTFSLPLSEGFQKEVLPAKTLDGWTWFPPQQTPEQLALITDAGALTVYGLQRREPLMFPLFSHSFFPTGNRFLPPRSQIVHAAGDAFWVVVRGRLYQIRRSFFADKVSPWPIPVPRLGTPIQVSQIRHGGSRNSTIYLGTRRAGDNAHLFTALGAPFGKIAWQRELGIRFSRSPMQLGDKFVLFSARGDVLVFEPSKLAETARGWINGERLLAAQWSQQPPILYALSRPQEQAVYVLSGANEGTPVRLHLRRLQANGESVLHDEWSFALRAPVAGTPAVTDQAIVLPLNAGSETLVRYSLPVKAGSNSNKERPKSGSMEVALLNWRADHADPDAVGHVVWLGGEEFLITDGSSGIRHIKWPKGQPDRKVSFLQLERRIAHPPRLLSAKKEERPLVVVADAEHVVTVLQTEPLKKLRRWPNHGAITAGPFIRNDFIGCVIDRRHLVWLHPDREEPLWKHTAAADIVGEPNLLDGRLVLADHSGRITYLDPKTGTVQGTKFTLPTSTVATFAPFRWSARRAAIPLSDGTLFFVATGKQ